MQTFTAPQTGTYKLEVWGAEGRGHDYWGGINGLGGYSYGNIKLNYDKHVFVCVGGHDGGSGNIGCYNGGGIGGGAAGGGATHIASTDRGELKNYESYKGEVLIVAGGGGGIEWGGNGGAGGGLNGTDGNSTVTVQWELAASAYGASQASGGLSVAPPSSVYAGTSTLINGSFGQGGCGYSRENDYGAGGGGGWYGGGGTSWAGAGGGGSGHIGTGVTGETIAGDQTFPAPLGGTETGHTGNGYCIISWIP